MKATPLVPGCGQLVCHATVPQLAQGAFMPLTPRKRRFGILPLARVQLSVCRAAAATPVAVMPKCS